MLHALELENFKAFGKRSRIPFAPITLIFGENSAGKSTILQALYLLKQTLESRETGALLLPRTENGIVDLGSFQEMLFDHDLKRTLSIRVDTKLDRELAIEFSFKRSSLEEEVLLDQINIYDGKSAKCIAKFQLLSMTELTAFWRNLPLPSSLKSPTPKSPTFAKCVWLTAEPEYWESEFEWCKENRKEILSRIERRKSDLESLLDEKNKEKNGGQQEDSDEQSQISEQMLRADLDSLYADFIFFSSDFDLKTYISKRRGEDRNAFLGFLGFLPSGILSNEADSSLITRSRWLLDDPSYSRIFDPAQLAIAAGRTLEKTLEDLFPMSPFRRPPKRWYIFTGTSPQHVGYQGDLLPDLLLRRPELVEETNEWLEKLNMGHKLTVKSVGNDSGDLFEVRLIDTRRKEHISVALPDVGFGVSQLLPFIVQSLVSEGRIISIEQPEVHVHPKLQADIGDLLAAAIKKENPNQFLVETHSEHLILRLQRLVRKKEIKPEDVSVIYVSRGSEGAKAERLRLDEAGDFIDDWPGGFFSERLREL